MGLFHHGVPSWLVRWLQNATDIHHSVETGTYRGDSALLLADALGACTSIEVQPELAQQATDRFADREDVTILTGDSRALLPQLCATLPQPAFFWLDGHWSGGDTGGAEAPCPLLDEIDAVVGSGRIGDVIAIDDARLFGIGHDLDPGMRHYPRLVTVLNRLEAAGAVTFVLDDIIVAVPPQLQASFAELWSDEGVRQRVFLFQIWDSIERLWQSPSPAPAAPTAQRRWSRRRA